MNFENQSIRVLRDALSKLETGFSHLPDLESPVDIDRMKEVILDVAGRMQDNYPYHHPLYAGQMLKPPHPVARVAYMLSLWLNPNNHALDGGKASSAMEKEAVSEIANMFGWKRHLGHLTGGGTMANMEGLWIAGKLHPGKLIVASEQAHSTHRRITEVLNIPFQVVPADSNASMDLHQLNKILKTGQVGTVVVTLGTTGTGSVDPLRGILDLQKKYRFRIHVDAAYGGYFILTDNLRPETRRAFSALKWADSIVIDPHKHGLQPYGAGCILFKDPSVGKFYKHDSPYTYFTSGALHLGEISLECSRAGASAVALWATQKLLPLTRAGAFANGLGRGRSAALNLYDRLKEDPRFLTIFEPELDILVWAIADKSTKRISKKSQKFFEQAALNQLHLALLQLPAPMLQNFWQDVEFNTEKVTVLRSCLMKPEHLDWIDKIWDIINRTADLI